MGKDRKQAVIDSGIFLAVIPELFPKLRPTGEGQALALCPFHQDSNPSMSVNIESGLYCCHACGAAGNGFDLFMKVHGCDFKKALLALEERAGISKPATTTGKPKSVAVFYYHDTEGNRQYWKKRFEPGFDGRSKSFAFYHKDEQGKEVKGRGGNPLPYNLQHLAALPPGEPVFFTEGEKKADVLTAWGLCATSLDSGGQSGKGAAWHKEYNQFFKGREVYILPDNDPTGEEYAATLAGHLTGVAAAVKILRLPGLPPKGDIIDFCKIHKGGK